MLPSTAVPSPRWLASPAPLPMTSGTSPRMKAKLVISTARMRRRVGEALAILLLALDLGLPDAAELVEVVNVVAA